MTPEIRHLLGGYATGTLTEAERARLFAAALDDQELFDALAEEQPIKDLLDDPESRGYLLAELDQLDQAGAAEAVPLAKSSPMRMRAAAPAAMPMAASAPVSVSAAPLKREKPPVRFWLPFAAVMMALVVTGWFWWRHEPDLQEVALNRLPPAATIPEGQSTALKSEIRDLRTPAVSPAKSELPPAVVMKKEAAVPAPAAAAGPEVSAAKKELDAVRQEAEKAQDKVVAENRQPASPAPPPAPVTLAAPARPALEVNLASAAQPNYRLLRLQNGQYVPVTAAARFQAGDTVVVMLPYEAVKPSLTLAPGGPIALEREGDWYRSANVQLPAGTPEFVVSHDRPRTTAARARLAAGAEAKAKAAAPGETLRIRLTVE